MNSTGELGDRSKASGFPDPQDILWTRVEAVRPGIHRAILSNIRLTLGGASGKPVFVWTFRLDSGQEIDYYTSKRGEGARKGYEVASALGLSRNFSRSEAVGRPCRIEVGSSHRWIDVKRVLPVNEGSR